MLCICGDTHIYCAVLRGKTDANIFEEEVQKKWMLDIVATVSCQSDLPVLAYCILDNEIHLIMKSSSYDQMKAGVTHIRKLYEKLCFEGTLSGRRSSMWGTTSIREIPVEWKVIRKCVSLHMMPVKRELVARPEDYWWCSYNDYLGRKWLPVTETTILLSWMDDNRRKAVKTFRLKHRLKKSL